MTGSRIFVQHAFIDGLIDQRDGREQKLLAFIAGSARNGRAKVFDGRAQLAAIAAVDVTALFVLTDALFSGFMIRHLSLL